jgi:hypothetical protein
MASSDQDQKSEFVRQRKRMAMGVKLDGQSTQAKGDTAKQQPQQGGLSQAKKNK